MMPLVITAKRMARIVEPNTKSVFCCMLANATHVLMFHDTIEEDSSSIEPCNIFAQAKSDRCFYEQAFLERHKCEGTEQGPLSVAMRKCS
jgi:hypothetical protein